MKGPGKGQLNGKEDGKAYGTKGAPKRNQEMENPTVPWSMKNALRHLGTQAINPRDKEAMQKLLTRDGKRMPTLNELAAAGLFKEATKGNVGAARTILEHLDGKPPQSVNIGGQPGNPVSTVSVTASTTAEEAYRRMLDGDNG